ncbi:hypothetical protein GCM10020001_068520 [Nonomuraea salmonea]
MSSAASTAWGTPPETGASGTKYTSPGSLAAASIASRVFPAPPAPMRETNRPSRRLAPHPIELFSPADETGQLTPQPHPHRPGGVGAGVGG